MREATLSGPYTLDDIHLCQHCGRLLAPGRTAWRVTRLPFEVDYVHAACVAAYLQVLLLIDAGTEE